MIAPDIRIVGDRFVFQSEVLFAPGSAELGDDCEKAARAGDRSAEGDRRQDPAGHQLDIARGRAYRPPPDQQFPVSVQLGIVDRPRDIGGALRHR